MTGRLTTCLTDGRLEDAAGMAIDSARDRAMICGSMAMLKDMCDLLVGRGFVERVERTTGWICHREGLCRLKPFDNP